QQQEIEELTAAHRNEPHLRLLQKKLAEQITCMVHSTEEYNTAVAASEMLFGKGTADQLASLDEKTLLAVFEGVPVFEVAKSEFENGIALMQLLTENAPVFPSKGELRRSIQGNGLSINKQKYTDVNGIIHVDSLISGKFIVVQKGKKDYYLIVAK
ncbi:MAG: tyrosine--tRNA ligase, partial [Bacteroidales bacterium]|nr:tyrosine--tRNA ligase [Bacteroidales bacterium]